MYIRVTVFLFFYFSILKTLSRVHLFLLKSQVTDLLMFLCFSVTALENFFLSLVFNSLQRLGVIFFVFILFGVLLGFLNCQVSAFSQFRNS